MVLQLAVLAACCWFAVRLATRPLHQLAQAADTLGPDLKAERLPEDGPSEVARAARAFNAMQDRIAGYMTERLQILAAISHDLQTPITRMRLRVDMMDDAPQHAKLQQDLQEMETLVKEGVAYARTLHGTSEEPRRIDPDALLDSMLADYRDAGRDAARLVIAPGVGSHGDHQRAGELGMRADQARGFIAIHDGHGAVHQHQIIVFGRENVQGILAINGYIGLDFKAREGFHRDFAIDLTIIHDKDAGIGKGHCDGLIHHAALAESKAGPVA
eukprot:gene36379-41165_t